ncbi:MAG: galactose mutarotase [Clostridiales bacterium]|nr:galactose mutarotase [Clostridiales bacterium]
MYSNETSGNIDSGIRIESWGVLDDREVYLFTIINSRGNMVRLTNYGGTLVSVIVPDKDGLPADVVLGYDSLFGYVSGSSYFGSTVGRYANRISNASFELNGRHYELAANDGKNHLHGGIRGFDKYVWDAETIGCNSVKLSLKSPADDEGYPGSLDVSVIFTFSDDNELKIDYSAVSDRATPVNLTNHAYFNLAGHSSGTISGHVLSINAGTFLEIDEECIPTGEVLQAGGTPMDFSSSSQIGEGLSCNHEQLLFGKGYDHNWLLDTNGDIGTLAAKVTEPVSGRSLEVYTTMPGIQFYSGNYVYEPTGKGKNGAGYEKRSGLCLETQYYPDSLKHPEFPSPILQAGRLYRHSTIYKFSFTA